MKWVQCTGAGIELDLLSIRGIKGCEAIEGSPGSFAVRLRYRWWVGLLPGFRKRAEDEANTIVRETHTAMGVLFMGAW
ncbi:hypothetical protein LCGC14_1433620 [marine sediment metagenome]|uniref:Uncharacterized protein n=1 Tax=marine sediment metagenome TaxID=412755 RepID=A0A0F9JN96_9ZZZZ